MGCQFVAKNARLRNHVIRTKGAANIPEVMADLVRVALYDVEGADHAGLGCGVMHIVWCFEGRRAPHSAALMRQ